jgi:hypothetical protein
MNVNFTWCIFITHLCCSQKFLPSSALSEEFDGLLYLNKCKWNWFEKSDSLAKWKIYCFNSSIDPFHLCYETNSNQFYFSTLIYLLPIMKVEKNVNKTWKFLSFHLNEGNNSTCDASCSIENLKSFQFSFFSIISIKFPIHPPPNAARKHYYKMVIVCNFAQHKVIEEDAEKRN